MDKDKKFIKKLPNIITIIRLVMIPGFVYVFFRVNVYWGLLVFLLASFSDVLDGYLARKYDVISDFGKLMDPLADKLLSVCAIVCLYIHGFVPMPAIIVLAVKEVLMILGGILLYDKKITVFANKIGKITTLFTSTVICLCFFHEIVNPWDWYLLYAALALQIFSLLQYAYLNMYVAYIKNKKNDNGDNDDNN